MMFLITLLIYFIVLLVLALASLFLFLSYIDWKQCKYFRERGVPYVRSDSSELISMLTGKFTMADAETKLYRNALKSNSPFVGISDTMGPMYMIMDLELAKHIYVKDADYFTDRRRFTSQKADRFTNKMLISLEGDHWKSMRSKLSPTFTTGKIKRMFNIFESSSQRMCNLLQKNVGISGKDVDICEAYSKYTIDVIAGCAFACQANTEFENMASRLKFTINFKAFVKFLTIACAPKLADWLGLQAFDMEAQNYFESLIKGVLEHRRKTGQRHDDFLQLMMDTQEGLLKNEETSKETLEVMAGVSDKQHDPQYGRNFAESARNFKIDDDDIVANCMLFLIGGFDTTQSLLIFMAYQLGLEQECQEKLRKEVNEAIEVNNGKLTYDAVHGMSFMDMFVNETLRYYPPAGRNERVCTKNYKIPLENGSVIEKGSIVALPTMPIQRDSRYYEDPDKFDPERFLPERKSKIHPYSFTPFGHGPRNCIGMRFALTEVKTVIAALVHKFKLEPCDKTDVPMKFSNVSVLKPKNGMWLNIKPICEE